MLDPLYVFSISILHITVENSRSFELETETSRPGMITLLTLLEVHIAVARNGYWRWKA